MRQWSGLVCLLLLVLTACEGRRGLRPEDLPTPASIESLATAQLLTANPPPPPFDRPQTRFSDIDAGLRELPGWRYTVSLEFRGVYANTTRAVTAESRAEVSFNQLASSLRVQASTSGDLFAATGAYEAVQLGPDAFLLRDGVCLDNAENAARVAAGLDAGSLIGGVGRAEPAGQRATINGEDVYGYGFDAGDLRLPSLRLADGGRMTMTSAELWIAPARGVVTRYYVHLEIENAVLLDQPQPVTGTLLVRYDVYDIGTAFNIAIPFGC
jgi:hypothetical protein